MALPQRQTHEVPLVSCIMPTRNRRSFVPQSIWYFLRQDYPHKELIILDDGEDAVDDLIPSDERIRYERLDRPLALGAKRNLACEMSRGELIAHWDDDDWMAPHRLSFQIGQLLESDADVCGARELLFYKPVAGEAWLYSDPHPARAWLAGGTLVYRRCTWLACRFPEINVGEDNAFIWQLSPDRLYAVSDSSFYVGLMHSGNTGGRNLADRRWQKCSLSEVSRLLAADREFYATLRNGRFIQPTKNSSLDSERARSRNGRPSNGSVSRGICAKTSADLPLVSCIMPTYNRRAFLHQAIEYFKRQDYPRKELIIVDDDTNSSSDLIPPDPRIRYIHLQGRRSIGSKRNRACEVAKGEIVMLWDDDDWYSDDRISYQAAPLLANSADVTAFDHSLVFHLPTNRFWECTTQLHARMFYQAVVGGTLAFRKRFWAQTGFPDTSGREDAEFLRRIMACGAHLKRLRNEGLFIYVRHHANTWQFTPGEFIDGAGWKPCGPPPFLPESDYKFYGIAQKEMLHGRSGNQSSRNANQVAPFVSCILTTGNRTPFLKQAIKYFLNQTYENRELIVVDDGLKPAKAAIPSDRRIKYLRLEHQVNLGKKLNLGIEHAEGEIIQKLDDDDYYHPGFLEATVNALRDHDPKTSIVGFDCFLVLIAATGELKFSGHGWCAGQTLCFYRKLWETIPFRDVPRAVDWFFLKDHAHPRIKVKDPELFIAVRHQWGHLWTNVRQLEVREYFQRKPSYRKSLAQCVAPGDFQFYEKLRKGFTPFEMHGTQSLPGLERTAETWHATANLAV